MPEEKKRRTLEYLICEYGRAMKNVGKYAAEHERAERQYGNTLDDSHEKWLITGKMLKRLKRQEYEVSNLKSWRVDAENDAEKIKARLDAEIAKLPKMEATDGEA